jgi:hypothetical protein
MAKLGRDFADAAIGEDAAARLEVDEPNVSEKRGKWRWWKRRWCKTKLAETKLDGTTWFD